MSMPIHPNAKIIKKGLKRLMSVDLHTIDDNGKVWRTTIEEPQSWWNEQEHRISLCDCCDTPVIEYKFRGKWWSIDDIVHYLIWDSKHLGALFFRETL